MLLCICAIYQIKQTNKHVVTLTAMSEQANFIAIKIRNDSVNTCLYANGISRLIQLKEEEGQEENLIRKSLHTDNCDYLP